MTKYVVRIIEIFFIAVFLFVLFAHPICAWASVSVKQRENTQLSSLKLEYCVISRPAQLINFNITGGLADRGPWDRRFWKVFMQIELLLKNPLANAGHLSGQRSKCGSIIRAWSICRKHTHTIPSQTHPLIIIAVLNHTRAIRVKCYAIYAIGSIILLLLLLHNLCDSIRMSIVMWPLRLIACGNSNSRYLFRLINELNKWRKRSIDNNIQLII